jgi:uncharacterized protein (TIGR00369 family)
MDDLDEMNGMLGPLAATMGVVITEATARRVAASMPVAGNTQPFGLLHGGASGVLAETVGSIAANLHARASGADAVAVGVDLHCIHHRSARTGSVHAAAEPVSLGRTLTTHRITITDDQDRLVASATLTCFLRATG